MRNLIGASAVALLVAACTHNIAPPTMSPAGSVSAPETTVPVPQRLEDGLPQVAIDNFTTRHADYSARRGDLDLLFIGDSITQGWGGAKEVWEKYYGAIKADQFGVGWDRTQHVLWRLRGSDPFSTVSGS